MTAPWDPPPPPHAAQAYPAPPPMAPGRASLVAGAFAAVVILLIIVGFVIQLFAIASDSPLALGVGILPVRLLAGAAAIGAVVAGAIALASRARVVLGGVSLGIGAWYLTSQLLGLLPLLVEPIMRSLR